MPIIHQTPQELIAALRVVAGMRQAADMLEKLRTPAPVDLRPAHPDIADRVARASAAWPGDYSSIAVALMDGCTTMQPNAADAIASLILLLQSVTKPPEILSEALQEKAREAQNWRRQQGDHPQWSAG